MHINVNMSLFYLNALAVCLQTFLYDAYREL